MLWLIAALAAHALNAFVFVMDKGILGVPQARISQPARYAAYSGLVTVGAAALLTVPGGYAPPNFFIAFWSLVAGGLWLLALWFFFTALAAGEASRVVPVAGASVPVFTLIAAAFVLDERLSAGQGLAVGLLVTGGALLSVRWATVRGLPARILAAAVASGAAFAVHFAVVKMVYFTFDPFLAAFAYTRLGVGVWALLLLLFLAARQPRAEQRRGRAATGLVFVFLASKLLGALALVLQNWAISLGSVTVVNALQGVQYVFILALALLVSRWAPHLLREERRRVVLGQKLTGIVLVGAGLLVLAL